MIVDGTLFKVRSNRVQSSTVPCLIQKSFTIQPAIKMSLRYLIFFLGSSALALVAQEAPAVPAPATAPAAPNPQLDHAAIVAALNQGNVETFLKLTSGPIAEEFKAFRAELLQQRGEQRFFEANIEGSLADFNEVIALTPERDPYLWQRGITLFYANQFQEGKEQFERHQTVNPQDVENAVWHFLCSVRAPGGSVEAARKNLIPITGDTRVPMKEIQALFSGKGSVEAVLEAADSQGNPAKSERAKNAFLYAHLYLGIYFEAIGETEKMKEHISKAARDFKLDHYMGKVAQVHAKLRGL
jgi:lipoprotein NlpI